MFLINKFISFFKPFLVKFKFRLFGRSFYGKNKKYRTLAVDPEVVPLGSPVWVDVPGFGARLMVAQDTGSAIKGRRGDIFIGSGRAAGLTAGAINGRGRMIWLRRRG